MRSARAVSVGAGGLGVAAVLLFGPTVTAGDDRSTPPSRPTTTEERALLHRAVRVAERECMLRKGFRFWITPENPLSGDRQFPYLIDDVAWARKHGYGSDLRRRVSELRQTDPNARYLRTLTPERRSAAVSALNGDSRLGALEVRLPTGVVVGRSSHGCTAEAETTIYGDLKTWFQASETTTSLSMLRRTRVLEDPRFNESMKRVLACIRRHGHEYAGLGAVRAAFSDPKTAKERAEEIRVAVTEATCAVGTGAASVADRLDREYEEEISRRYRALYSTRYRLELDALPRARSVLGAANEQLRKE